METLWLKLRARAYVAFCGFFYLSVGVTASVYTLSIAGVTLSSFWPVVFVLAGISNLISWPLDNYHLSRYSLSFAAAVSLGFSFLFLAKVFTGDYSYLLACFLWIYTSFCNWLVARAPDPYPAVLVSRSVRNLKTLSDTVRDGRTTSVSS